MFFLNFTVGEFFILFGMLGALTTALYMLERSKRKKIVSTLRFWLPAGAAHQQQRRKRIREPWSLLLQLLSILLLLLALGQIQWGNRARAGREHVLLVDTSAWSSEHRESHLLIDEEKKITLRYLSRLPKNDRVLLVGVDAFTTPMTSFTSDRALLSDALKRLKPSYSALKIGRALSFALRIQSLSKGEQGEIVYVGPGRVEQDDQALPEVANLRTIIVRPDEENSGIRRVAIEHDENGPDRWHIFITVENYGKRVRFLHFQNDSVASSSASRSFIVQPFEQRIIDYHLVQKTGTRPIIQLKPDDALPIDNQVQLRLPQNNRARVAVFTDRPKTFQALLGANPTLDVTYFAPTQYRPHPDAEVILLDRFSPARKPELPSVWIAPPQVNSPLPAKTVVNEQIIKDWSEGTVLAEGLREKETRLKEANVFQTTEGDIAVASVADGPVVVVRPGGRGHPKLAVLGFDPLHDELRFQATVPLLFANLFRWLSPGLNGTFGDTISTVGYTKILLRLNEQIRDIHATDDEGGSVPFVVHGRLLEIFTNRPSRINVQSSEGAHTVSPMLANVADGRWTPPQSSRSGLPPAVILPPGAHDLWKWMAAFGGLGLLLEWLLFGGQRRPPSARQPSPASHGNVRERELVR